MILSPEGEPIKIRIIYLLTQKAFVKCCLQVEYVARFEEERNYAKHLLTKGFQFNAVTIYNAMLIVQERCSTS